jgi:hypothetical protein
MGTRELPAPSVRVGFAAIEASDRFGTRWDQWAARLGVRRRQKQDRPPQSNRRPLVRVRRVNRMASLCCLIDSWKSYWNHQVV